MKDILNKRLLDINNILIDSASESGCVPNKSLKPKAYWCPELSALRDKKRFWWSIWAACDKPRTGIIFDILKDLKKKFRYLCRRKISTLSSKPLNMLNFHFKNKDMCAFWNKLKANNHNKVASKLIAKNFADHYSDTMSDKNDLTAEQVKISKSVKEKASTLSCICTHNAHTHESASQIITTKNCSICGHTSKIIDLETNRCISEDSIIRAIKSLKNSPSSGCDWITVNHLFHALSEPLIEALVELYSAIITTSSVPDSFETGIIIPILKKATLDSNNPSNFRPITLSSVHSKVVELSLMPEDVANDTPITPATSDPLS